MPGDGGVAPGGPGRSCVGCSRAEFAPLRGCDLGVWVQSLQYLAFPCLVAALSPPAGSVKNPIPRPRSASFCCLSCTPCKKKTSVCVRAQSKCGLPAPLSRAGASRDEARGARGCQNPSQAGGPEGNWGHSKARGDRCQRGCTATKSPLWAAGHGGGWGQSDTPSPQGRAACCSPQSLLSPSLLFFFVVVR